MNNIFDSHFDRVKGGLWGGIVGDALGVPVEFTSRKERDESPVVDMIGHGTYDLPKGTWSDDTSMAICGMETILKEYTPDALLTSWCEWAFNGKWTPYGRVFDIGISTQDSLYNYKIHKNWKTCGGTGDSQIGNGSLMRAMPFSIWLSYGFIGHVSKAAEISSLTHAHPLAKYCCAYHAMITMSLLKGQVLRDAMLAANFALDGVVSIMSIKDSKELSRIISGDILKVSRDDIQSTGYAIHCLEASLWCLENYKSFSEATLAAVNLGDDTDTTACVTGGLAGIMYGLHSIPQYWLDCLARKNDLESIIDKFSKKVII